MTYYRAMLIRLLRKNRKMLIPYFENDEKFEKLMRSQHLSTRALADLLEAIGY